MKLLIATQNQGKQKEIVEILKNLPVEFVFPDTDVDIEETGETFEENAFLKVKGFYDWYDDDSVIVLADDSGLAVDHLEGQPGVYSKRYGKTDPERMVRLLEELGDEVNRSAKFICVMCVYGKNVNECFEGEVHGQISREIKGEQGFGYDPVFIPNGYEQTFAQLGNAVKNTLSHRARALEKVREFLKKD